MGKIDLIGSKIVVAIFHSDLYNDISFDVAILKDGITYSENGSRYNMSSKHTVVGLFEEGTDLFVDYIRKLDEILSEIYELNEYSEGAEERAIEIFKNTKRIEDTVDKGLFDE